MKKRHNCQEQHKEEMTLAHCFKFGMFLDFRLHLDFVMQDMANNHVSRNPTKLNRKCQTRDGIATKAMGKTWCQ